MRDYELTLILRADLEDDTRDQILSRVQGWLPQTAGGKEPVFKHWGRRQLAYPIRKQSEGYYVLVEAELEAAGIADLERNIIYVDDILRHLVVRKGE